MAPLPEALPVQPVTAADIPAGVDLRDYIEREHPDAVISRDPRVLAYVESLTDYFTIALPWNETYALTTWGPIRTAIPVEDQAAIAREAVTGEARAATSPVVWHIGLPCDTIPQIRTAGLMHTVAYPAGDETARQLAERVVSLASGATRPTWIPTVLATTGARTVPVSPDSLQLGPTFGRYGAIVVPVSVTRPHCLRFTAVALIETRSTLIVRRGSGIGVAVGDSGKVAIVRRAPR